MVASTIRIRCEQEQRGYASAEKRELRFVHRYEKRLLAKTPVLCISEEDRDQLRARGWQNVELLPMSIPDEEQAYQPPPRPAVSEQAPLRLLWGR